MTEKVLYGYDIDGVMTAGITVKTPYVIISGRTFAEYDHYTGELAQGAPLYIRGAGAYGDHQHAGEFKAMMINWLGVTEFHEDHPQQIAIIEARCPDCKVVSHA